MEKDFRNKSRAEILSAFGYSIVDGALRGELGVWIAQIDDDPEAFTLRCETYEEAEREAYDFLMNEIDPEIGYKFPEF